MRDDLDRGARQQVALRVPDMILTLLPFQSTGRGGYRGRAFGIHSDEVPTWPSTGDAGYALDARLKTLATGPKDPWAVDLARAFRSFRAEGKAHVMVELHRHLTALLTPPDDLAPVIDRQVATRKARTAR